MKALVLITSLVFLTNCGFQNQINELREKSNQSENKAARLEQDAKDLAAKVAVIEAQINLLTGQLDTLRSFTFEQNDSIVVQLTQLQHSVNSQNTQATEQLVESLRTKIAELYDLVRVMRGFDNPILSRLAILSTALSQTNLNFDNIKTYYQSLLFQISNLQSRVEALEQQKSECSNNKNKCKTNTED